MTATQRSTADTEPVDQVRARAVERKLDRWLTGSSKTYDSVVIAGGHGITTHAFAARLARDPRFAGKVVLAGPFKQETRRLIGGVSVRAYAADFLAYAAGIGHRELLAAIDPSRVAQPSTRQVASMATQQDDGTWEFSRVGPWQMHRGKSERPVMYGFRNSRTAVAIRELIADGAVQFVDQAPVNLSEARDLALGDRPLMVNGSSDDGLFGNDTARHDWGIIAAQVPFAAEHGVRAPLAPATTFAPLVRREGTIDVGYYTPFQDPLTPDADWYGIIARPARTKDLSGDTGERHKRLVTDELLGIGRAAGLRPVDADETLAVAGVAGYGWRAPESPRVEDTFELRQSCSGGVPAYYADGILCAAMGGLAAAEAIIRGADPSASAARAIRQIRRWNYLWWFETTKIAAVADGLMRISVPMAMVYPHSSSVNSWASAA